LEDVMKPTQHLVNEHENILMLLEVLDRLGDLAPEKNPPLEKMAAAIELVQDYADGLHHGKEETLLFPMLEARGVSRHGGPIGCMLKEHEVGRGAVAAMGDALDRMKQGEAGAGDAFASASGGYTALLREHIAKENEVLFPWAEELLSENDRLELCESFERIETEDVGRETVIAMLAALRSLAEEFVGEPIG
jgi:hemerythrin-like domain-containing protein